MGESERVRVPWEQQRLSHIRREHPEWYQATGFHWLDTGPHDFWNEAFQDCGYDPQAGQYTIFDQTKGTRT